MKRIAEEAFRMVVGYRGSWSSEHGDGLVRSPFNERFFGPQIYRAFSEVKRLFDPGNLMNPGKIVDAGPIDENLRFGTAYRVLPLATEYRYREDGSFAAAVEMCTGVGQCRKTLGGTMCPSYIATRDEEHSTRGRANALRLAMSGQLADRGAEGLASRRLYEVLELCLGCKGCKAECPSNVDLAKLKSEFLQGYYDRRGTSRRDRLIAGSADLARRLAGPFAPLVNATQRTGLFRRFLESLAGVHRQRTLPDYAREPFPAWFAKHPGPSNGRKVVLFADTYLSYHEPGVGRAAVELLRSCGYQVVLAEAGCCQRPRISHGFLRRARRDGERTLRNLDRYLGEGLPVVVCEPGCASALTDDLPDLVDDAELGRRVARGVTMIDVFLDRELEAGHLDVAFEAAVGEGKVLIHGHCHQKALWGTAAMKRVLRRVEGLEVAEVDSGCCGMAGSFGYEREHYELSRTIGEDRLFPALRDLGGDTPVVACGFSCRHQIEHFIPGRRPLHWVEVLRGRNPL
jgi:Fe-S oxidoreductase